MKELGPEALLSACGTNGPLEVCVEHPRQSGITRHVLPYPFALIGRQPGVDIVLQDDRVSSRHAYLQVIGGRPFVVDLLSRTGIQCGDRPWPATWVDDAPLLIGPYSLRVSTGGSSGSEEETASPLAAGPHRCVGLRLEICYHNGSRASWQVDRPLVLVGRSEVCKIRLHAASVSRIHCAFLATSAGLLVLDLGGRGGVTVNRQRIRCAALESGDTVEIGEFAVRVCGDTILSSEPGQMARVTAPPASIMTGSVKMDLLAVDGVGRAWTQDDTLTGMLLLRLMDQFTAMQQQMHDQFQKTLLMILQAQQPTQGDGQAPTQSDMTELLEEFRLLRAELARGAADKAASGPSLALGSNASERPRPITPMADRAAGCANGAEVENQAGESCPEGLHALLCERLQVMEQEGKGRWRRLFDFLFRRDERPAKP